MPKRLMVLADDDSRFAERLAAAFVDCEAAWVPDPGALTRVLASRSPDVVLLEPNLPGRSWWNLLKHVCGATSSKVIVLTSYPSSAMLRCAQSAGAHGFLLKPCGLSELTVALVEHRWQDFFLQQRSQSLAWCEWEHINNVIEIHDGNMSAAAKSLAIPRQTLYRKLRKYPGIPLFPRISDEHWPFSRAPPE